MGSVVGNSLSLYSMVGSDDKGAEVGDSVGIADGS